MWCTNLSVNGIALSCFCYIHKTFIKLHFLPHFHIDLFVSLITVMLELQRCISLWMKKRHSKAQYGPSADILAHQLSVSWPILGQDIQKRLPAEHQACLHPWLKHWAFPLSWSDKHKMTMCETCVNILWNSCHPMSSDTENLTALPYDILVHLQPELEDAPICMLNS